ncbi:MAG: hypothetical protein NDI82_03615 [Anaeromyxobacteraceae bacterium]|nr:hypothetical protein [Anaeromyxobacteraceae bacterium]
MKRLTFESRELVVGSIDEVTGLLRPGAPFAVLLAAGPSSPTPNDRRLIEVLAVPNCREMCFAGVNAEALHDLADDVVEARGLRDIVTTWLANDPPAEVAYYFVRVAGGLPTVLVAAADHERALSTALEGATKGETGSS